MVACFILRTPRKMISPQPGDFYRIICYICGMEDKRIYKPFAVTAYTTGHPRKLFTPITVVNPDAPGAATILATTVNAMWDSGAEVCLMSQRLADRLEFVFENDIESNTFGGKLKSPIGYTCVTLVSNGGLVNTITAVVAETSPTREYDFIIGLNFIRKGTLAITSTDLDTTLSFVIPSPVSIDFTKLADIDSHSKKYLPLSEPLKQQRVREGAEALELFIPKRPESLSEDV